MTLRFIGTSDGYPEKDRKCSCTILTINGRHYVIDAGYSLYTALVQNDMLPQDVAAVFITHMHGDHSSGLIEYIAHMKWGRRHQLSTDIFVPSQKGKYALEALAEVMDPGKDVDLKVYSEGVIYSDDNVKVTACRTLHGAETFGFLVEAEGKRIYFTGDMKGDISDMPTFVYEEKTDIIICESAHNKLFEIAHKLNKMQTNRIIVNHVAKKHSVDDFEKCKPLITKPFDLAYDGMVVSL